MEDDDIPDSMTLAEYMTEDVLQLVDRLGLVTPDGELSPIAQSLVQQQQRGNGDLALADTLAELIREHYRGAAEVSIAPLL